MFFQSILSTEIDLLEDSLLEDFWWRRIIQERCATSMCAGWRISFCKEGKKNILCKGMNWVGKAHPNTSWGGTRRFFKDV